MGNEKQKTLLVVPCPAADVHGAYPMLSNGQLHPPDLASLPASGWTKTIGSIGCCIVPLFSIGRPLPWRRSLRGGPRGRLPSRTALHLCGSRRGPVRLQQASPIRHRGRAIVSADSPPRPPRRSPPQWRQHDARDTELARARGACTCMRMRAPLRPPAWASVDAGTQAQQQQHKQNEAREWRDVPARRNARDLS